MMNISTLLVEDNVSDADLLAEELDSMVGTQFTVMRVQTLKGARETMGHHHFDLILLDLSLPDSLGLDTLAAIRTCAPQIPVIVLTGLDDRETALFAARMRANDYLVKGSYNLETLSHSIRVAVEEVRARKLGEEKRDPLELIVMCDEKQGEARGETSALRAVEKERNLLAAAVSSADDPVIITDRDSNILYVNPAFSRVTGYTPQEVLGSNPRMLQSGEHDKSFFEEMYRIVGEGRAWNGQLVNRRKNGETFQMDATITCLRNKWGNIENYVMVSRDITDFTELQRQLNRSMRLNAIGQLAGGIAHDFNNVLQVIMAYGSFLMDETRSEEHRRFNEYAKGICDAARRASDLTRQLLAFGRKQPLRTEVVDLNELIQSATHLVDRLIGENIILVLGLDPALPRINVDAAQIEQIVVNLCVNARDAMPSGGEIRISTTSVELGSTFCQQNAWASPGRFARLCVTDSGVGMPPEVLEHIFEPFFTTKDEGSGTGMGLASVYGIVKQQKGLIQCDSTPGVGTAFSIYFPASTVEDNDTDPIHATADESLAIRGARILIAEDDQVVATLARTLLEGAGFQVTVAPDGHAAFQELLMSAEPYALVLSDVVMPRTGGVELLDLVIGAAGISPKPKFLLSSGYSPGILDRGSSSRSSFEYLQKPYSPAELLMTVRRMLHKG